MVSRAEAVAIALVSLAATVIVAAYVFDTLGLGLWLFGIIVAAVIVALAAGSSVRSARPDGIAAAVFVTTALASAAALGWWAWPSLLPGGSGPDLTHHLMLIDYLQLHGTLVHDPEAWRQLGEMAHYTPGLHVLAVVGAQLAGTDGLFAVYPIVVASVALKFGFLALSIIRLIPDRRLAAPAAIAGIAMLLHTSFLTLHSFTHDSFLAQVVAELFAVAFFWGLIVWSEQPSPWMMLVLAGTGLAVFLTWPLWLGPLLLALAITVASASQLARSVRIRHAAVAIAPVAIVATMYTLSRVGAVSIVAASGAVRPPSLITFDWWLLPFAVGGLILAMRRMPARVVTWLVAALLAQASALWAVAEWKGAATPYMAIKMTYLLIYPLATAAAIAFSTFARVSWLAWIVALVALGTGVQDARASAKSPAVVSGDLYAAGVWARTHLPPACVDYLVANEYTAYWLHLAVLRNPRMSERTANDDLYLSEPSFARWVEDRGVRYAIARSTVLPAEIRQRTRVLWESGRALVIERISSTPDPADGTCGASPRTPAS